ncbi:MAG: rhamnogalacturonan acetylesterase [Odoribacteraceae bacterium]|jgi:lysophospholipase L1-like esterase|nr:rhamnogalacturonan acetylesterase [Odoribacteraceae bacterium]
MKRVAWIGAALLSLALLQPGSKPRLVIIGDSTVRNGAGDGRDGQWGWGDQIARYFDTTRITIVNRAIGGRSSRTFITEGRWKSARESLRPGDFVLVQFGHNDGGAINDTTRARGSLRGAGEDSVVIDNLLTRQRETVRSFGAYLRVYARETRERGATPVFLSPVARNRSREGRGGRVDRSGDSYAGWTREVALSEGVPFIDLNELSAAALDEIIARAGQDVVDSLYFHADRTHTLLAGARLNARLVAEAIRGLEGCALAGYLLDRSRAPDAPADDTHFNAYGAHAVARCVIEGFRQNGLTGILQFERPFPGVFDPARPGDPRDFSLPPSPRVAPTRLPGN